VYQKEVVYDNLFKPGEKVIELLYFHLMSARVVEMELEAQDRSGNPEIGLGEYIPAVTQRGSGLEIMELFKTLLKKSYGERKGDKFIQTDALSDEFIMSQAFDQLLQLMLSDPDEASRFVNGIMPREVMELANGDLANAAKPTQTVNLPKSAILVADIDPAKFGEMFDQSGLENPLTDDGTAFVAWWNREPTPKELQSMGPQRMKAAFARKASGWTPPSA
jgi:hypothetical protein